jgi:hypothetical protein
VGVSLVAAGSIYVGLALLSRWSSAPKLALRLFATVAVLQLADLVAAVVEGVRVSAATTRMASGLIWILVWALYVTQSKRVHTTYAINGIEPGRPWLAAATAATVGILILSMGLSAHTRAQGDLAAVERSLTPYDLVKYGRRADPARFDAAFTRSQRHSLRRGLPQAEFVLGDVRFSDAGGAIKSVTPFTGRLKTPKGTSDVTGTTVALFHKDAVLSLSAFCLPSVVDCTEMSTLLTSAETAATSSPFAWLEAILPTTGDCETESGPRALDPASRVEVLTCSYQDAIVLSAIRLDGSTFVATLEKSLDAPPNFKREIASAIQRDRRP